MVVWFSGSSWLDLLFYFMILRVSVGFDLIIVPVGGLCFGCVTGLLAFAGCLRFGLFG